MHYSFLSSTEMWCPFLCSPFPDLPMESWGRNERAVSSEQSHMFFLSVCTSQSQGLFCVIKGEEQQDTHFGYNKAKSVAQTKTFICKHQSCSCRSKETWTLLLMLFCSELLCKHGIYWLNSKSPYEDRNTMFLPVRSQQNSGYCNLVFFWQE